MPLTAEALSHLADQAIRAARKAADAIAARMDLPKKAMQKSGIDSLSGQVVTDTDLLCQKIILDILEPAGRPHGIGLLTEELPDDGSRLQREYFWSIDPLDGTLAFVEGRPGFAVSIALVSRTGVPMIGVVADPSTGILTHAVRDQGIFRQGRPPASAVTDPKRPLTWIMDRSFSKHPLYQETAARMEELRRDLGYSGLTIRNDAGAVINACRVLEDVPACYFKFPRKSKGGGSLWDFAATACLLQEAGAVATDMAGAPLDLNRRTSTFMMHRGVLFASDRQLAAACTTLARAMGFLS